MSDTTDSQVGQRAPEIAPTFHVVVNVEEQYSIWDTRRTVPAGWTTTGFEGVESACLAHIDAIWTDMRPRSLRSTQADYA